MEPTTTPSRDRTAGDLRMGIVFAALMLAAPLAARLAGALGWGVPADFSQRALMVLLGAFLALTGNSIPKRLVPLGVRCGAARVQAFQRLAGWTWVLTGVALALAWMALPASLADPVTFVVVPAGILIVAWQWAGLVSAREPLA